MDLIRWWFDLMGDCLFLNETDYIVSISAFLLRSKVMIQGNESCLPRILLHPLDHIPSGFEGKVIPRRGRTDIIKEDFHRYFFVVLLFDVG